MAETRDSNSKRGRKKGPHLTNRISAVAVRKLGPGRHADGGGLYLDVDPSGARRWFLRTLVHGRRKDVGIGPVDLVPLAEAREIARTLRRAARDGLDPVAVRDEGKRTSPSFEEAARIVHRENILPHAKNAKAATQWLSTLEAYAFPVFGKRPVHLVEQADVLRALAPIWTEVPETARRVRQRIRTVLDWARAAGHREGVNPVDGVEKGLPKQKDRTAHFAAVPWRDVPAVYDRIAGLDGMGALALRFVILTACRSGEARGATWDEIDAEVWHIPAQRMKAGRPHRVPLSEPALAVLREAKALARPGEALVFPSARPGRPLSDMTLLAVLKRLGVAATVHGFRSAFRDWAEEETAYPHEVKEAALAHTVRNAVEAAYRRSDLLDRRRDMMADWAAHVTGGRADD